jgi:GNAT superfamily N-acetyltransferase
MVKFCEEASMLDPKIVGREESVKREVNLLIKEYDGEKTYIKKNMWKLGSRRFVSVYCGRICVGVIMMNILKDGSWQIANAVVDKRARGKGLGKLVAQVALRSAFTVGAKRVYLGAELNQVENGDGTTREQKPKESGAFRFWSNLRFRRIGMKEYSKVMRQRGLYGVIPMKMTIRSKAVYDLPHLEETLQELFPKLNEISEEIDGKSRIPMLRLCTSEIGDVKVTENKGSQKFIFH